MRFEVSWICTWPATTSAEPCATTSITKSTMNVRFGLVPTVP
jgi:hypothetical protein